MPHRDATRLHLPAASRAEPALKLDCRHYRGDRPCVAGVQGVCPSACEQYGPMYHRILVIKLGALGDVVRTTALLPGLRDAWPHAHVTWVTRPAGVRMLANHPLIDRLLPFDAETLCHLECERFDLCLSLDKEPAPAALAMRVSAAQRRGIGMSRFGTVFPLNAECAAYFRLGLDDELKFHQNEKSYPQLIYEALRLRYAGQRYRLYPGPDNRRHAERVWQTLGVAAGEVVIGLNTGAGEAFANKTLPEAQFTHLADALVREHGWRVALLGGPAEAARNRHIAAACAGLGVRAANRAAPAVLDVCAAPLWRDRGPEELDFAALLARCQVVVTGDTLALHVAIAAEIPCVALFGPTCAQEIDLYGRGTKIETTRPCSPCYRRTCDHSPTCMDDIPLTRIVAAVEEWVGVEAATPACPVAAGV